MQALPSLAVRVDHLLKALLTAPDALQVEHLDILCPEDAVPRCLGGAFRPKRGRSQVPHAKLGEMIVATKTGESAGR